MKKKCIKCNDYKVLDEFYNHKQMFDGRLNKCKSCCKEQSIERYNERSKDDEWIKKERYRHRDKYHRLNYKNKQRVWDNNKPWKNNSIYKGLHKKIKPNKGIELHHWNYNDEFLEDVVLMDIKEHRRLHRCMELDIYKRIFKIKGTDIYLDTRCKHLSFIKSYGFKFTECNN